MTRSGTMRARQSADVEMLTADKGAIATDRAGLVEHAHVAQPELESAISAEAQLSAFDIDLIVDQFRIDATLDRRHQKIK